MSFLEGYKASLKPIEIEEPIDYYVHRPLAYIVARALFSTPITPNMITVAALAFGLACGLCFLVPFPNHLPIGGGLLFVGTILDCTDGQLARMRKTASELGRMLDGVADAMTLIASVGGSAATIVLAHLAPPWHAAVAIGLILITIHTTHWHLTAYDHYKNLFVRLAIPGRSEGEDLNRVLARQEQARRQGMGPLMRAVYFFTVGFLVRQRDFMAWFDPDTDVHLDALPAYDAERAAIYRKHALLPLRILRIFMGMGSLVFGMMLFAFIGRFELYMAFRLVFLNAIFWLVFWPLQRRASREAFREMGLRRSSDPAPLAA